MAATDITIILVPTPSEEDGSFSLRFVTAAATELGRTLRSKDGYHTVVLTSTVLPGDTEAKVLPVLEAESGKHCGAGFGLCYSPEFIALGTVLRDLQNPDFVLIGEFDEGSGSAWEAVARAVCDNEPPVARMNLVNAELAKISVNTFVTMKISFANMLAALCEQLPGADVDVVTNAVGMDTRVGRRYLKGALGFGGPCFPRDNRAFAQLARMLGEQPLLAEATDAYNQLVLDRIVTRILSLAGPGSRIAVLGMAYKPGTNIVEQSQGLLIAHRLAAAGLHVVVHDPVALHEAQLALGSAVEYAPSHRVAVEGAHVVVIANPEDEYRGLNSETLGAGILVLDAWRLVPDSADAHISIGRGLPSGEAALR